MKCKKIAFINGKGGCGKTTSIFHVAGVLSQRGEKVLVIDLDKQRNTTDALLMENEEEIEYTILDYMKGKVGAEKVVKHALFRTRANATPKYYGVDVLSADVRLENEHLLKNVDIKSDLEKFIADNQYSWVLVDMPPSHKTLNQICFSQIVNSVIVPFTSDFFSVNGYGDLIDTVNKAREYNEKLNIVGIYLSRYMANCAVDKYIKEQLESFGDLFINLQIPLKSDIREAVMFGRPISYYKESSPSKTAYEELVIEIERRIEDKTL